jgi:hypothetical protein
VSARPLPWGLPWLLPALGTPLGEVGSAWARLLGALPQGLRSVYTPVVRLASAALVRLYQCYGSGSGGAAPPALVSELKRRMSLLLGAGEDESEVLRLTPVIERCHGAFRRG